MFRTRVIPIPNTLMISFIGLLIGLAYYDWKHRLIKNKVLGPAFVLAVFYRFFMHDLSWINSFAGLLMAGGIFFIGGWLGQVGGGDIKLMALVGFIVGFSNLWIILGLLSLLLTITWIFRGNQMVPFAPYILVTVVCQYGWTFIR